MEKNDKACGYDFATLLCLTMNANLLQKQYEKIGVELDPEQKFGAAHFLMMGLNRESGGVYSQEDVDYSRSFATAKERNTANLQTAFARLKQMGLKGYFSHIGKKMLTTYNDGTFAWYTEGAFYIPVVDNVNTLAAPLLKSIYYENGQYYSYFQLTEHVVWIAILLLSLAASFIKVNDSRCYALTTLMLSIIGLTLFEILFEVRARYLFIFVPIYCVLATMGVEYLINSYHCFMNRRKR